jgi:hypothetical protein
MEAVPSKAVAYLRINANKLELKKNKAAIRLADRIISSVIGDAKTVTVTSSTSAFSRDIWIPPWIRCSNSAPTARQAFAPFCVLLRVFAEKNVVLRVVISLEVGQYSD